MVKPLLMIGIMTGNSVDGVDVVLTAFHHNNTMQDLCAHFLPFDRHIYNAIRALQRAVADEKGNMESVVQHFSFHDGVESINFDDVHNRYILALASAVQQLMNKAKQDPMISQAYCLETIDAIGLHGQTCDHCPPSRIGKFDPERVYTVQIGSGQQLADITGITVVSDFRSDDLMCQGEAAPVAPMHHYHLAQHAQTLGYFPMTFCNAGNTGNISHITYSLDEPEVIKVLGWDTGPFNHYSDYLMRFERQESCDLDGKIGMQGAINIELLRALFHNAVALNDTTNFLLQPPPKSGDPNYYKMMPELGNTNLDFVDRLRTAQYFSAYIFVHSLSLTPPELCLPPHFAVFGGGWNNPVIFDHFQGLLAGDDQKNPILSEHKSAFQDVQKRLKHNKKRIYVAKSHEFGFDGQVMEARIFADMARCRLMGIAFSTPDITGATRPVVSGIIRFPQKKPQNATQVVRTMLEKDGIRDLTLDRPDIFDARYSRACAGWSWLLTNNARTPCNTSD